MDEGDLFQFEEENRNPLISHNKRTTSDYAEEPTRKRITLVRRSVNVPRQVQEEPEQPQLSDSQTNERSSFFNAKLRKTSHKPTSTCLPNPLPANQPAAREKAKKTARQIAFDYDTTFGFFPPHRLIEEFGMQRQEGPTVFQATACRDDISESFSVEGPPFLVYLPRRKVELQSACFLGIGIEGAEVEIARMTTSLAETKRGEPAPLERQVPSNMWTTRYTPNRYIDLVTDEVFNRTTVSWLKSWLKETTPPQETPRIWLVSGNPGVGKTSAVRTLIKASGFAPVEINASVDRTESHLNNLLWQVCSGVDTLAAGRPKVLLLDEVEGCDRRAVEAVAKYVQRQECRRPVICTCNDLYDAVLHPIRRLSRTWRLEAPTEMRVVQRLRAISDAEKLPILNEGLNRLYQLSRGDMRACLGTLQRVAEGPANLRPINARSVDKAWTSADTKLDEMLAVQRLLCSNLSNEEKQELAAGLKAGAYDADPLTALIDENLAKTNFLDPSFKKAALLKYNRSFADAHIPFDETIKSEMFARTVRCFVAPGLQRKPPARTSLTFPPNTLYAKLNVARKKKSQIIRAFTNLIPPELRVNVSSHCFILEVLPAIAQLTLPFLCVTAKGNWKNYASQFEHADKVCSLGAASELSRFHHFLEISVAWNLSFKEYDRALLDQRQSRQLWAGPCPELPLLFLPSIVEAPATVLGSAVVGANTRGKKQSGSRWEEFTQELTNALQKTHSMQDLVDVQLRRAQAEQLRACITAWLSGSRLIMKDEAPLLVEQCNETQSTRIKVYEDVDSWKLTLIKLLAKAEATQTELLGSADNTDDYKRKIVRRQIADKSVLFTFVLGDAQAVRRLATVDFLLSPL